METKTAKNIGVCVVGFLLVILIHSFILKELTLAPSSTTVNPPTASAAVESSAAISAVCKPCECPSPEVAEITDRPSVSTEGRSEKCDGGKDSATATVFVPQIELMGPGAKVAKKYKSDSYPTFNQGLRILHHRSPSRSVYSEWRNCSHQKPSSAYTQSNINQTFADWVVQELQPKFMVEVGSFTGLSSVKFGQAIVNGGLKNKAWLLCIDTWLGDLNMWVNRPSFASFMSWRAGEPELYDQWMSQIISADLTDVVLPMRQSSIIGARFLKSVRWIADFIFLDSAHEVDETFNELVLFWDRLAPGGILLGDDYVWRAVRHDVNKFASVFHLTVVRPSELLWYIRKPADFVWPEALFRRSLGYYRENVNVFVDAAKARRYRRQLSEEEKEAAEASTSVGGTP